MSASDGRKRKTGKGLPSQPPSIYEIELKFAVPEKSREALEKALKRGKVQRTRMQAIYFDTADERLASAGVSLRLRKEGRAWVQTLKVGRDPFRRLEHNVSVRPLPGIEPPALDLARHNASPASEMLRKALDQPSDSGSSPALSMRFRTQVSRLARTIRVPGAQFEIALDTGTIVADDRSLPICELELELKSGRVAAMIILAAKWANRYGLWVSTISKAERGTRLARGEASDRSVKPQTALVDEKQGSPAFFVATIESCLAHVFGNASEVGAGDSSEPVVHQLRIGLRRLRTALREMGTLVDGIDLAWEPRLRETFRQLGAHRDITIVVPTARQLLNAIGAPSLDDSKPRHGIPLPETIVRDTFFQRTLLDMLAFVHDQKTRGIVVDRSGQEVRPLISGRLDELRQRIAKDGKRFDALDPDRQHRVRKRLKRLRYLCEFAAPLFGVKEVTRYLFAWRKAQDALGEYNDLQTAAQVFRQEAQSQPHAWFAVGWIKGRQGANVKRCTRALRKAAKTPAFW